MPTVEVDNAAVVRVVLAYLKEMRCIRAMRVLEEETGLVQGEYGKDLLFLRNLVLDGRWEDAQDFVSPFAAKAPGFDVGKVMFQLKRQKFLELVGGSSARPEVMELVDGLKQLEGHCSKQEFNNLCYCLTLNTLTDHPEYRDWNPHIGRMQCFQAIRPYFEAVLARQWVASEATRQPVPPQQLLRLMAQAATFQTLVQVQAHPDLEPPFHLNFAVDSPRLDASLLRRREVGAVEPAAAVDMCLREWADPSVTAKPLAGRGNSDPASDGANSLAKSAVAAPWRGAGGGAGMAGMGEDMLASMAAGGRAPKRVRVRQRNPTLSRSMAGCVEDPSTTPVYRGRVGQSGGGSGGGVADALAWNPANDDRAVASAVRAAGEAAAPLSAEEINTVRDMLRRSMQSDALKMHQLQSSHASSDGGSHGDRDGSSHSVESSSHRGSRQSLLQEAKPHMDGLDDADDGTTVTKPRAVKWEISWSPKDEGGSDEKKKQPPAGFGQRRFRDEPEPSPEPAPPSRRRPPPPPPATRHSPSRVRVTKPRGWAASAGDRSASALRPARRGSERGGAGAGGAPQGDAGPGRGRGGAARSKSALRHPRGRSGSGDGSSLRASKGGVRFATELESKEGPPSGVPESDIKAALDDAGAGAGSSAASNHERRRPSALFNAAILRAIKPQSTMPDSQPVRAIGFDPTGAHIVVGTNSRRLRICGAPVPLASRSALSRARENGSAYVGVLNTEFQWDAHHLGSLYCVAWSDDGNLIASGSNDTYVKVVRAVTWPTKPSDPAPGPVAVFHPKSGTVRDVAFLSTDEATPLVLSAGGGDCAIRCWHIHREAEPLTTLSGHDGVVFSVAPCGPQRLLSASADGTSLLWDLRTTSPAQTLAACASGEAHSVHPSPSGNEAAVGYVDGLVRVWDLRTNRVRATNTTHTADCRSVHYSPDGSTILTASFDGSVALLQEGDAHRPGLHAVAVFNDHTDRVLQARWHPKSPAFVTSSADKSVLFWSVGVQR